jgi:hypothetical protein
MDWSKMPTDLDELYADLSDADIAGDDATAAIIAKRINMVQSATAGNVRMDEEYNPAEKFLIGAGRGAMDLAQGAKQKALMAGEALGVVPEGRPEEYTNKINEEVERFESDFPGIGAESVGRFAGWAAPAAITGGGAGMLPAMAMGALEGGIMPTETAAPEEAIKNAVLGATVGATGKGIQYGLQSRGGKQMLSNISEKAEELYNRYNPVSSLQDETIAGSRYLKDDIGYLWNDLDAAVGHRVVDDTPIYQGILDEIDKLQVAGGDPATMNKLIQLWDNMPRGKDGQVRWRDIKEFRSNFSGANAAKFGQEGMSEGVIKRIYGDITEVMKRNLKSDAEYNMFQDAVDATTARKMDIKASGVGGRASKDAAPDEDWFINKLNSGNADSTVALTRLMTDEGVEGAKAQILRGVTNDFLEGGGSNVSSTTRYKKLTNTIDKLFDPDEAAEIRSFIDFLDIAKKEASLQTALRGVMASATIVGGAKAGAARFVLPSILRNAETKAIMRKLATTKKGTRLYQDLTGVLTRIFTQGAAGAVEANDPYTVMIRDGVQQ